MPKYIGKQIDLPVSKILHPHVFEVSAYGKYELMAVVDPEQKAEWNRIQEAIESVASEAFGISKTEAREQFKNGTLKSPIQPHKEKNPATGQKELTGEVVFSARQDKTKGGPLVVDASVNPIPPDRASEIYYGIFGVVVVFLMAWSANDNDKGVTARINVLQKQRDAEGGGGRRQALNLLKAIPKADDAQSAVTSSGDAQVDAELDRLFSGAA